MTDAIALLILLIGLELVLGVDNVLVISIFTGRLQEAQREESPYGGFEIRDARPLSHAWDRACIDESDSTSGL